MEKEMNQELEWLEAQKIEISVDLFAAAKKHLKFLGVVDRNRWLYDGPSLEKAIFRYNAYWLPLLAKYTESSSICEGPLVPPLDCEWVWHCHRLNPVRYKSDCEEFYGRVLDNSGVVSSVNGNCKVQSENLWKRLYPMESYDLDLDKPISKPKDISVLEKCTTYDLVSAVKRQSPFYYQVSRAHVDNDVFLQEAVARYKAFLYLIKKNRENSIKLFCVPTYDIDLIWHTHQLHAFSYCQDLEKMIGKVLEHDDTDSDRSKGKKLDTGFSGTTAKWEETFGRRYWKAGAMNRGNTPKPITTSPYVLSGREVKAKEEDCRNVIRLLEVEVIEVILEIVGVKNLPDAHKGKVFVLFSKTQPDSLFNTERKLTVLSESFGEKQVALFQCEPKGELSFKLMSSSFTKSKTLGFATLSLSEFLFPVVTKLSVEKWLPLKTGNSDDLNPISLRVAVSFTSPTRSPTILHLIQARPSLKDSCFFPIKSRLAKSVTHVVDENERELISLQMRNSNDAAPKADRRQVIGVKECGESNVLAEYDGKFWSLLDSKWSLKPISNPVIDGPLFELSGTRMVKVYLGRKLEYEPKHCAKQKTEQDFIMTLVEFSKKNPYGKAVGLLDLKFGSIEVNEEWMVLPGAVSSFILNDVLKKEGFTTTAKNAVKCNGITEEIKKETEILAATIIQVKQEVTMNVETTQDMIAVEKSGGGGARCFSKDLNGNGEDEGSHCGGCGGCSGCGGGCGNCGGGGGGSCGGGMTKIRGCGGGCGSSCTGGSTGCGNCGGGCGNMMKNNATSIVVEAEESPNN